MTNKYNIAVASTGHANSAFLLFSLWHFITVGVTVTVLFALLQDNIKMRHFVAVNAAKNSKSLL